jgi:AcrR family transcriptional regulator
MNARPEIQPTVDQRLLGIAAEHIRRFGAARTTIVGVAEEAGMSHANVYRYFPSKTGLLDAVTAQWLKPLEMRLQSTAQGADPAYDKLERILSDAQRAYSDKLEIDPNLFGLLVTAVEKSRGVARKHRARVQGEVQRVVEEGMGNGVFAIADQKRAMALVFDMTHRFLQPAAVLADAAQPRAAMAARFDWVMRLLLRALRSGRV